MILRIEEFNCLYYVEKKESFRRNKKISVYIEEKKFFVRQKEQKIV